MRNFDFSPLYRSAIGFDRLVNLLEEKQKQDSNNYPPYNVELVSENKYRVSIAVTGFAENELEITAHDNIMTVKGVHASEHNKINYLYQSIDEHNFERNFQLSEFIQIKGAHLVNGMLFIDLEQIVPETLKPRRIEIN